MSIGQGLAPFAALERSPLFAGLEPEALSEIAAVMEPLSYACRRRALPRGRASKRVHVIASGMGRALAPAAAAVATRRVGDVIGAASVLTGEPHPETVVATMPTETLAWARSVRAAGPLARRSRQRPADQPTAGSRGRWHGARGSANAARPSP